MLDGKENSSAAFHRRFTMGSERERERERERESERESKNPLTN
jgi:hypothetical protein